MNAAPRTGGRRASFLSSLAATAIAFCAAILACACQSIPEVPGRNVEVLYDGQLEQVQPMDVVVAPIIDQSKEGGVPTLELRRAFQRFLIKRRYSALSLPYTDSRVVDAAYKPGALSEDAILQVTVREWDLSRWESNGEVKMNIEAWMLSAQDQSQLWGAKLERTLYLTSRPADLPTKKGALGETAEGIARELLEVMPARNPRP